MYGPQDSYTSAMAPKGWKVIKMLTLKRPSGVHRAFVSQFACRICWLSGISRSCVQLNLMEELSVNCSTGSVGEVEEVVEGVEEGSSVTSSNAGGFSVAAPAVLHSRTVPSAWGERGATDFIMFHHKCW